MVTCRGNEEADFSEKVQMAAENEKENQHTIKDLNFQPESLVLIWNTEVESLLDKKMKPRYMGPMVVIS